MATKNTVKNSGNRPSKPPKMPKIQNPEPYPVRGGKKKSK